MERLIERLSRERTAIVIGSHRQHAIVSTRLADLGATPDRGSRRRELRWHGWRVILRDDAFSDGIRGMRADVGFVCADVSQETLDTLTMAAREVVHL